MTKRSGRRGGGRAARHAERVGGKIEHLRYITRNIPSVDLLSDEGLALIEENSETILEEIGIDFREDAEALELFKDAGADIDGERVRFPRGLARHLVSTAPSTFTQLARNPERSVEMGGRNLVFAPVYGPPFIYDIENGRRYAQLEDFQNIVKLAYMTPSMHHSGGTVCEPVDVPVNKRHLDMVYAHMRYSDKPFMGSVTHPERAADSVEMAKILFGADVVDTQTVMVSLINANSPMTFDATMLGALKVYARANQGNLVTPFILAGAMAPVSLAGTMAQTLAEALAGMALVQLCRPGAPVIFGSFLSSMSMQTRRTDLRHARGHARHLPASRRWPAGSASRFAAADRSPHRSCLTHKRLMRAPRRYCRPCWRAPISCSMAPAGSKADWPAATRNSSSMRIRWA